MFTGFAGKCAKTNVPQEQATEKNVDSCASGAMVIKPWGACHVRRVSQASRSAKQVQPRNIELQHLTLTPQISEMFGILGL